ncbi:MAG: hypothetical protein H7X80_03040 [bacterium]|nr:hypothetical protein [Candidatus Kapabacteria bacterium]
MRKLIRYCTVLCVIAIGVVSTTELLVATTHSQHEQSVLQFNRFFGDVEKADSARAIPAPVAIDLARRILRIERLRNRLASDHGFLRSADDETLLMLFNRNEGKNELMRAYSTSLGSDAVSPDLFKHLDIAIDALWIEITRLAPTYSSGEGHPLMKSLAGALEQRLRAVVPKATFVGGMLREKEWQVKLSALGLPESRCISGVLFYRLPGQDLVICREFEVAQKYFKRSTASGSGEITFGSLRLQQNV